MVWSGAIVLFVGAILTFAVNGDMGPVDVTTAGAVAMFLGAALLTLGLLRRRRGRRGSRTDAPRSIAGYREQVYRTGKGKIFAMVAAAVYILSPIDFIPDFLLPVGIVDDATAFGWLLYALGQEVSRRRRKAI
ncbi:MAG TPA: YkvA family protein [Actinomadura sp.]|jgi:uncharacterized membrane protein YkvA (DUF1232 family)|nr:YkvA family protein [Actinomadura sp.]